jgi:cytochrome c oxidase assembly protein subunit 15
MLDATAAEPGYAIALTGFLLVLSLTVFAFTLILWRNASANGQPVTSNDKVIRRLAWWSLVGVVIQGILGGMTVRYYLPVWISTSHATLGQSVFCMTLALAVLTGKRWNPVAEKLPNAKGLDIRTWSVVATGVVVVQLIVGAVMRHMLAGLAIPTFPLAFGQLIPEFSSFAIVINFAHRVGALTVSVLAITMSVSILRHHREQPRLRRPAIALLALLALQITLGSIVIWNRMPVTPTTLHVSTGAAILGTVFYIALQSRHLLARRTGARQFAGAAERTRLSAVSEG